MRKYLPLLLLLPFIALLWVPFYNRAEPSVVVGFPFFYVWMFAWIVLAALSTWVVSRGGRA